MTFITYSYFDKEPETVEEDVKVASTKKGTWKVKMIKTD